jgi:alpha-L-fucosidase
MTRIESNPESLAARAAWWTEARFGLFIHWGLYSLAARHEWVKSREQLADEHYQRYFDHFYPDLFDPAAWARAAVNTGMRYVVITTKHHDGFCLWDSELTDYKVTRTPWAKDLLGPALDAFRQEGLRVGLYHSSIDWHHPEFPLDGFHPQRDDAAFKANAGRRDIAKYRQYLHGQVRELLTRFGRIDYLFFDFTYADRPGGKGPDDWGSDELMAMVRELQPDAIVNDRLGIPGDFVTPEQYQPAGPMVQAGEPVLWEACQTLNDSWGYDRDNLRYKTAGVIVRMLVDGVSKNGNLLLNIGPTGRGELDPRSPAILAEVGEWMRLHGRSIYGCGASDFVPPPDARYTQRADRLYLHLFAWPYRHIHLPGLAGRVRYAQLLNDASEVGMQVIDAEQQAQNTRPGGAAEGTLSLELPVVQPPVTVPVVELFLA